MAITFAAAKAREVLGAVPDRMEMLCSGNIIKNVTGVTVPNSGGLCGVEIAAVLGIVDGDATRELEGLRKSHQITSRRRSGSSRTDFSIIRWQKRLKTCTLRLQFLPGMNP